ncbi:MAG: deoxyribonuclease IV [Firmicutes bacterium]|nr:deoxyribonuclease IV [Bacillota bacterium]
MRLGAFLSIAKGIDKVVPQAQEIGANTFQFFTRNPRGGAARTIGEKEIARWLRLRQEADMAEVCGHLPYTVNMASDKPRLQEFASMVIVDDLRRMAALGVEYLVVHPGSSREERLVALERIVRLLDQALASVESSSLLLLETMAMQGNEIGSIEEIAAIWHALGRPAQVGVCLDSCHLFAAGYDFRQYAEVERLVADLDQYIGLEQVKVLHLNDSKMPSGSRRDRHANIGEGEIGELGFANLLSHPFIQQLAWQLETPIDTYRDYAKDIARVRQIIGAEK